MTRRSPDLIPSPVSLLATSPLVLSMSAAQKYFQVQRCIRVFIYLAFALYAPSSWKNHTFLLLPSLPPLEGCIPLGSLNLLGHGTYHLYYNYLMICGFFSALDFKVFQNSDCILILFAFSVTNPELVNMSNVADIC